MNLDEEYMALHLHTYPDAAQTAQALAQAVGVDLAWALASNAGRALLLVSGGRSPLPFFAELACQDLPWERIDVSLVDERSVPFDHPDSNAALVKQHLLQGRAAQARLLPLMAPAQAGENAWDWAQRSATIANANPQLAQPAVVVLGLGADGHTASLFIDAPQWDEATTSRARYVALKPTQAPHARVSLSLQALIGQRRCHVWSGGAAKLAVIHQAQAGLLPDDAGPFVRLAAHPEVMLEIFHAEK